VEREGKRNEEQERRQRAAVLKNGLWRRERKRHRNSSPVKEPTVRKLGKIRE